MVSAKDEGDERLNPGLTATSPSFVSSRHTGFVSVGGSGANERFRCLACHQDGKSIARTSIPGHLNDTHQANLAAWKIRQEAAAREDQVFQHGIAAAYAPGEWDAAVPEHYSTPEPAWVPPALPDQPDLPMHPVERIPIAPPPAFDPELERERLEEQARIIHQLNKERDEFGEQFFDENEESAELREAFAVLGEQTQSIYVEFMLIKLIRNRQCI
jgi:hypothetical protein